MFEQQINNYKESFLSGLEIEARVKPFELLKSVADDNIVKYYIAQRALLYGDSAISAIAKSEIIDSDSSGFRDFETVFARKISEYIVLTNEKFHSLLDSAVHSCFNFMIRPQVALEHFIYAESNSATKNEVTNVLNYFNFYTYLTSGIQEKLKEISKNELSKEDFIGIVKAVDNDYVYNASPDEFMELLAPMIELFKPAGNGGEELSAECLLIFFDDKEISPLIQSLEGFLSETGQEILSKDDIRNLFGISGTELVENDKESGNSKGLESGQEKLGNVKDRKEDFDADVGTSMDFAEEIETLVEEIPSAENPELSSYKGSDTIGDLKKELNSFQALQEGDILNTNEEKIEDKGSQDFEAMAEGLINGDDLSKEPSPAIEMINEKIDLSTIVFDDIDAELEQMKKSLNASVKKDTFILLSDFNTEPATGSNSILEKEIYSVLEEIS